MTDPVMDREGNSYERAAIMDWLNRQRTSPITRSPLSPSDLVPNRGLKDAIEEYKAATNYGPSPDVFNRTAQTIAGHVSIAPVMALGVSACNVPNQSADSKYLMVSVVPPDGISRLPSDIVIVVDVSGSMGNDAAAAGVESSGLCILDIVKHAVKTIIQVLGVDDRLSVVSYSNSATVIFDLLKMDTVGKARAAKLVDELTPDGMTNLWDGLHRGLEILKARSASTMKGNAAVLLLTDGEPNIEPPRGHIPMLQRYKDTNGGKYPGIVDFIILLLLR